MSWLAAMLRRFVRRFVRRMRPRRDARASAAPFDALSRLHEHYGTPSGVAPSVLYFGDSVLMRIANEDQDRRTVGELVVESLPALVIAHSAYHPQVYLRLLAARARMPRAPRLVILAINIRCFSPQWDLNPEYQFVDELAALQRYAIAPGEGAAHATATLTITPEQRAAYAATPVTYPSSERKSIGEFLAIREAQPGGERERVTRLAQIFKFHYTHPLRQDHRKLLDLRTIIGLLREQRIRGLLYLTPINHEAGLRLAGESFGSELASNRVTLREELQPLLDAEIQLADYSEMVSSDGFVHPDIANEHLNERGRKWLAAAIIERAMSLLE